MTYLRRYSKAIAAALSALASSGLIVVLLGADSPWVVPVTTLVTAVATVLAPRNTQAPPKITGV